MRNYFSRMLIVQLYSNIALERVELDLIVASSGYCPTIVVWIVMSVAMRKYSLIFDKAL